MNRTMAVHVRYKSLLHFVAVPAKQQREMTKCCVVNGTWTTTANFLYFHLVFNIFEKCQKPWLSAVCY